MTGRRQTKRLVPRRQRIRQGLLFLSFLLLPVTLFYLSPYLSVVGAAEGVVTGSLLFFALLFLSSLVLGRAFCGWACPGGGFDEACPSELTRPHRRGWRDTIKFVIWVPWIASIAWLAWSGGGFHSVDPVFRTSHGLSVASLHGLIIYLGIVTLFLVPALVAGRRGFCHSLCWMAPFMVIGRRVRNLVGTPALHLRASRYSCNECGRCETACPMSLDVPRMVAEGQMEHDECILCGSCVDGCKRRAIVFAFRSSHARPLALAPVFSIETSASKLPGGEDVERADANSVATT